MNTGFHAVRRWIGVTALAVASGGTAAAGPSPAFAAAGPGYWSRFVDYWTSGLREQNGVVLFVLGAGAVGLFIITRGKWIK